MNNNAVTTAASRIMTTPLDLVTGDNEGEHQPQSNEAKNEE
jgi:hypothetical protein